MTSYTEAQKRAWYKWRSKHSEYDEYYRLNEKKWRENNPEKYKTKNKRSSERQYNWKKISKTFLNILLEQ